MMPERSIITKEKVIYRLTKALQLNFLLPYIFRTSVCLQLIFDVWINIKWRAKIETGCFLRSYIEVVFF